MAQALSRLSARMQSNQASSLVTAGDSQVVCRTVSSPQVDMLYSAAATAILDVARREQTCLIYESQGL